MKQVFRLMGMPDKVIAFDELPERLTQGFELSGADGFPRHWKEWMGKRKKITRIPNEKDFLTGQLRTFAPIVEEDHFFYLVDWRIKALEEKWKAIGDFVRNVVSKDFRLMDTIDAMAKPLAPDKISGITLEPEDVVVIPIPIEYQEKESELVAPSGEPVKTQRKEPPSQFLKCDEEGCNYESEGPYAKNAIRLHKSKKHKKETVVA